MPTSPVSIDESTFRAQPQRQASADSLRTSLEADRRRAAERVVQHRQRIAQEQRRESAEHEAKARFANVDLAQLRIQAERRVMLAKQKATDRALALERDLQAKRQQIREKRALDLLHKDRRRAEIYALNHVMYDFYKQRGMVD